MLSQKYFIIPILSGFITALLSFIFINILYLGFNINPLVGKKEVGFYLIAILLMIFAVNNFRKINNGEISFSQGYGTCFLTIIFAILFWNGFLYYFLENIAPNAIKEYIATESKILTSIKTQTLANGISEEIYNEQLNKIFQTNITVIIQDDWIRKVFLIVPSIMVSLYFKRKFIK